MAKYLSLWQMNTSAMPSDPAERATTLARLSEMTKKALDEGGIKEWGIFPGGNAGYGISEGSAADALGRAVRFAPYVTFTVQEVLSIDQVGQLLQSMKP